MIAGCYLSAPNQRTKFESSRVMSGRVIGGRITGSQLPCLIWDHRTLPGIYFSFFSFFNLRFSFELSWAFFCCSLLPLSFFPLSPIFVSPYLKMACISQAVHDIRQTAITPTTKIRHMTSVRRQMNSDKLYFELRNTIPRAIKPQTNSTFAMAGLI